MSPSVRFKALIRRNPTYWSGRCTRRSVTFLMAVSQRLKKVLWDSSLVLLRWNVIFDKDAIKSSSWSSPKFSGKLMSSSDRSPLLLLLIQRSSLSRCFFASNGVPDNFWSNMGPRVLARARVVANQSFAFKGFVPRSTPGRVLHWTDHDPHLHYHLYSSYSDHSDAGFKEMLYTHHYQTVHHLLLPPSGDFHLMPLTQALEEDPWLVPKLRYHCG